MNVESVLLEPGDLCEQGHASFIVMYNLSDSWNKFVMCIDARTLVNLDASERYAVQMLVNLGMMRSLVKTRLLA